MEDQLARRLDALEAENRELRRRLDRLDPPPAELTEDTRRRVLELATRIRTSGAEEAARELESILHDPELEDLWMGADAVEDTLEAFGETLEGTAKLHT